MKTALLASLRAAGDITASIYFLHVSLIGALQGRHNLRIKD